MKNRIVATMVSNSMAVKTASLVKEGNLTKEGIVETQDVGGVLKLHTLWALGKQIPKDWSTKRTPSPAPSLTRAVRRLARHIWAQTLCTHWAPSEPVAEPVSSAIEWFKATDMGLLNQAIDRNSSSEGEDDQNDTEWWHSVLTEGVHQDFEEGASLIARCHELQVVDEGRLVSYDASDSNQVDPWSSLKSIATRSMRGATVRQLLADGCKKTLRGEKQVLITRPAISEADAHRDEVGPWSYTFTTRDGETVELGYEGVVDSFEYLDPRGLLDEGDTFIKQESINQGLIKKAAGDNREERSFRFSKQFEIACKTKNPLSMYQALWVRYRGAQLAIGKALDDLSDAPERLRKRYNKIKSTDEREDVIKENRKIRMAAQDHSMWSTVYLTRTQFDVLEGIYAARTEMGTRMKDGRLEIARYRDNTKEVLGKCGLPYRKLRDSRQNKEKEKKERWAFTKAYGWGKVIAERHDSKVFLLKCKDGQERKVHVDYLTMK